MNRRALLITGTAAIAGLTLPHLAEAASESQTVPHDKVFMYLSNYYNLPPAERTDFKLAYGFMLRGVKADQVSLTLNANGASQRLTIDGRGDISPLPTPEQIKAKATLTIVTPKDSKVGINFMIVPTAPLAQTMTAPALNNAISQTVAGSKKMAGLLAMAMPKFDRVVILGVTSGKVTLANGETKPLPVRPAVTDKDGHTRPAALFYRPADWPTAKSVSFDTVPSRVMVGAG